jgi:hypothetical protein
VPQVEHAPEGNVGRIGGDWEAQNPQATHSPPRTELNSTSSHGFSRTHDAAAPTHACSPRAHEHETRKCARVHMHGSARKWYRYLNR